MLDFQRHRRAAARPGPVPERRLLVLLVGVGLVVLLMIGAGNPRNWRWLTPEPANTARLHTVHNDPQVVTLARADRTVDDDENGPPGDQGDDAVLAAPGAATDQDPAENLSLFPGVRADYLSAVRDDTVFPAIESDGWFHLFALLERTPNEELLKATEGPVTYLQLDQQPNEYRGHLVTVQGIARAAKLVVAPENAFAVKQYYQLWLQPDRGTGELLVLYCLELPQGFPIGPEIEAECTATGFFFKRWAYQSQGGITTAPLVIAKTLAWQPPPPAEPAAEQPLSEQLLTAIAAALALAVVVLVFVVRRNWHGTRRVATKAERPDEKNVGAALASLERDSPTTQRGPRNRPRNEVSSRGKSAVETRGPEN